MKSMFFILIALLLTTQINSCKNEIQTCDYNIIFLHHSTGGVLWKGSSTSVFTKVAKRVNKKLGVILDKKPRLPRMFAKYNKDNGTNYLIKEMIFPKEVPYGWHNYPYDYYNIWVKNAGEEPFVEEPTLELLTKEYNAIIFKHCFPVSNIQPDLDSADLNSDIKTISNYKLQYLALRDKLHEFPDTKFILFTGAAQVKARVSEKEAQRAKEFFSWVIDEWDLAGDNIFLWDLYSLETEGGLFFKDEFAISPNDSHPNGNFASKVVKLLFYRIIDVIENNGNGTNITGNRL